MCGIIGFTGLEPATPLLLQGLAALEYRGYDSAGIALTQPPQGVTRLRASGRLQNLVQKTAAEPESSGAHKSTCGIAHTRWATHGAPTESNAHPHQSQHGTYTLVHNGILENHLELRNALPDVIFSSETDTEVIVQLLDQEDTGDALTTLLRVLPKLTGSYALAILDSRRPDEIFCARKGSPLLAARTETGAFVASDAAALLPYTRELYRFDDGDLAILSRERIRFFTSSGQPKEKERTPVARHVHTAEKGDYAHFMQKEIYEQPETVRQTLAQLLQNGTLSLGSRVLDTVFAAPESINRIVCLGCGSAWHVGVAAQTVFETLTGIPTHAVLASEFRSAPLTIDPNTLVIVISQSGETADTLMALRRAKTKTARTLGIINVENSSIAEESNGVIYTQAGLEVAVATTKAYSTQLVVIYAVALFLAELRHALPELELRQLLYQLQALPEQIEETLRTTQAPAQLWAEQLHTKEHAYFIGRGLDHSTALEGSLKLKEISYIHAEAYAAGELKHGTISLIEQGTPVLAIALQPELTKKTLSNMAEVQARGAALYGLCSDPALPAEFPNTNWILLPVCEALFSVSLAVLPLQLFAYHTAFLRACDIDKPRSLAKSVTVE